MIKKPQASSKKFRQLIIAILNKKELDPSNY